MAAIGFGFGFCAGGSGGVGIFSVNPLPDLIEIRGESSPTAQARMLANSDWATFPVRGSFCMVEVGGLATASRKIGERGDGVLCRKETGAGFFHVAGKHRHCRHVPGLPSSKCLRSEIPSRAGSSACSFGALGDELPTC